MQCFRRIRILIEFKFELEKLETTKSEAKVRCLVKRLIDNFCERALKRGGGEFLLLLLLLSMLENEYQMSASQHLSIAQELDRKIQLSGSSYESSCRLRATTIDFCYLTLSLCLL